MSILPIWVVLVSVVYYESVSYNSEVYEFQRKRGE